MCLFLIVFLCPLETDLFTPMSNFHTHRLVEKHSESCSCNTPRQLTWLRPHTSGSVHPIRGTKAELVPECEFPITLDWDPQSRILQVRSWTGLLWWAGRDTINLCGTGLDSLRVCDKKMLRVQNKTVHRLMNSVNVWFMTSRRAPRFFPVWTCMLR